MSHQQRLFEFDEQDDHPSGESLRRLSAQCDGILARLRHGPASNRELSEIAMRFGARIQELRKHGHRIEIVSRDHDSGCVMYEWFGCE